MTARQDPLERVRAANPVPAAAEPDWERITEHVANGQRESLEVDRGRGVRRTLLGGLAFCVAVAVAVLIALAPWSGSSDFLARAAAALTPPGPGSVLYERWEHIVSERGNPVFGDAAMFGPEQLWIEGASPRRYRAVLEANDNLRYDSSERTDLAFTYGADVAYSGYTTNWLNRLPSKLAGRPLELGGELEAPTSKAHPDIVFPTLTFVPPNELLRARLQVALGASLPGPHDQAIEQDPDPVSVLRAAIAEGRAHEAGVTDREGLSVLRIDLDLPTHLPADAPPPPANAPVFHREAYAYVEPGTFRPVEVVFGRDTYRFLAYEYLPASAANRALTDIRAQHPTAAVVSAATKPQRNRALLPGPKAALKQHRR
ncbi:MAG: hypothetical protein ABR992_17740 [Solirubrobacteraceae bacterium]|jgi:hypothetical protein